MIIITYLCILIVFLCIVIYYRNEKTYDLRMKIVNMCKDHDIHKIIHGTYIPSDNSFDWFYDSGPGYEEMLFSLKPIKLESFYSKEKIERLLSR